MVKIDENCNLCSCSCLYARTIALQQWQVLLKLAFIIHITRLEGEDFFYELDYLPY
jgi:hypothetical protein